MTTKEPEDQHDEELDDDEDLDDADVNDEGGAEGDDDGDSEESGLSDSDLERIAEVAAEAANRVADKRINQALSKQQRKPAAPKQEGGDEAPAVETASAARYIKVALRDEIADLNLPEAEARLVRKFAVEMVGTADLSQVADEDAFAADIASRAADMVTEVQTELSQSLRSQKKRRGGESNNSGKKQPGKKPKGTESDSVASQLEAGKKMAAERHAERT